VDVKHQVFVSSTYVDLVEERREVMQALLELSCIPAGMEMFPAANEDQWELIKTVIDESDYYVVIVGGRYGSVTAEGISYTEKEFDYAVERGKPVAGFVHASPGDIPASKTELDPAAAERLDAFREKVKKRVVKTFTDPASLGGAVSRSLVALMKKHPQPGWVRGENAMTDATRAEIANLRASLADMERSAAVDAVQSEQSDPSYSQGSDEVELRFQMFAQHWADETRWEGSVSVNWDGVFGALGPLMIDEASSNGLRNRLDSWLLTQVDELPRHISELALSVNEDDWQSVIIQLRALRLMTMSVRKRGVADKETYWTLTPAGDRHLVELRASRRAKEVEPRT
jgi:hypothetical protein